MTDVALAAGVSSATVSRFMSGAARVHPDTAIRVRDAIEQLGYRPNALGRALRVRRSRAVALLVADIENPFLTAVIRGVESVLRSEGRPLLLFNANEEASREAENLLTAAQTSPAGVIVTPVAHDLDVADLLDDGVPVVSVDRPLADGRVDNVLVETRSAARHATQHLLDSGRTRVALITGPHGTYTAEERYAGWCDALRHSGIQASDALVRFTDYRVESGRRAAAELLAAPLAPDGIVAANSLLTLAVVRELGENGLSLREVGVVAFDDAPWGSLIDWPLATVRQPAFELGQAAARALMRRLALPHQAGNTTILHAQFHAPPTQGLRGSLSTKERAI